MADFGGFLERRKKEKNLQRNTEMSAIDGLVNNLQGDMNKVLESARRRRAEIGFPDEDELKYDVD